MLAYRYKRGAAPAPVAFGVAALCAVLLAGCAGNGDGLDSNGQPIGSSPPPDTGSGGTSGITADLQSIQDNVFTPICTQCHIGAGAPEGLQLDAAHAYSLLVGVSSNEKPGVLRVKASDPDSSYIIQKLEGASGIVGGQMPLNQTPLPAATITAIRTWISNGAMPAAATGVAPSMAASTSSAASLSAKLELTQRDGAAQIGAVADGASQSAAAQPFAVTVTAPLDDDDQIAPVATIVVAFNHEVDASLINGTTVTLQALTAQNTPRTLALSAKLASSNPSSIVILPASPLAAGTYRVTVRGTGGGALADVNAQSLGADFSFVFNVSSAP